MAIDNTVRPAAAILRPPKLRQGKSSRNCPFLRLSLGTIVWTTIR